MIPNTFNAALTAIASFVLLAAPASAQNDDAAIAFAKDAVQQMRAALPDATFEMEPGEPLQINVTNAPQIDEGAINLHRVYGYCLSSPATDCQAELTGLITAFSQERTPQGPDNLRVVVRDAGYWAYVVETLEADAMPLSRQIGEDLYAILAIDSPQTIALASEATIADFGLSPDQAWTLALEQTAATVRSPPLDSASMISEGMLTFAAEEYGASIILDTDRWEQLAALVGPDMIVVVLTDQLAVAASFPDGELLDGFKVAVEQDCAASSRCVSPNVYRLRGGRWVIAD